MIDEGPAGRPPAAVSAEALLDALLQTVAHDLKSPLLTLALSADLLTESGGVPDERTRLGLEGVRGGAKDLERMVNAITSVSRARRRPLQPEAVPLARALDGRRRSASATGDATVAVDPRVLAELVQALGGPGAQRLALEDGAAVLSADLPEGAQDCVGTPVAALFASLTRHAGTVIEALSALQVQLERQGGSLTLERGRAVSRLPLVVRP